MALSFYFAFMIEDVKTIIHQFDYKDIPKLRSDFTRMIQLHLDSLEWVFVLQPQSRCTFGCSSLIKAFTFSD